VQPFLFILAAQRFHRLLHNPNYQQYGKVVGLLIFQAVAVNQ
jgi:hypothetical protein